MGMMTITEMRDMVSSLEVSIMRNEQHREEAPHNDKREYFQSIIDAQKSAKRYYEKRIEEVGFDNIEEFSGK